MRSLISLASSVLAAGLLAACGGGEDGDDEKRAQDYAVQVERISDHAYETAQGSLVTLDELTDGSFGRVVLAYQTGSAALSRALRNVVVVAAED
jgi:hypothetical protein